MSTKQNLFHQFLAIVEEIPRGKVATYGQIAALAGHPKNSRLVGQTMARSEFYGEFPCHRVVNAQGQLVLGWLEQRELLEEEGVGFLPNGKVNLKKSRWEP